jgi:gentisate 1,2-dioxygenase
MQIDKDTSSRPVRTNCNVVCCVVEGAGRSRVGNQDIDWKEKDIFTVPPGNWVSHQSDTKFARLFMVSDRDALGRLGVLREELGNVRT